MGELVYTTDTMPGLRRQRRGRGFAYRDPQGRTVRDAATLARIRQLAIPPAYTDVWICADAHGHLQATGRDARGRKQYRYHRDWQAERGARKYDRLLAFADALPRLRRRIRADLALPGFPREKVLALVVALVLGTRTSRADEPGPPSKDLGRTEWLDVGVILDTDRVLVGATSSEFVRGVPGLGDIGPGEYVVIRKEGMRTLVARSDFRGREVSSAIPAFDTVYVGGPATESLSIEGKRYRGGAKVFANPRHRLTVANRVSVEGYLRGVLPQVLSTAEVFAIMSVLFAVAAWPHVARGVRAIVAVERTREYADAARAAGAGPVRLVRHLLPAARGFLAVEIVLLVPALLVAEATVSYLGLGFPKPGASWGTMLQDAANVRVMAEAPWMLAPAAALFLVVLGVQLLGSTRASATVLRLGEPPVLIDSRALAPIAS